MHLEPYGTWKKTGLKICNKCTQQKPIAEFPWKSNRNAPSPWCLECQKEYSRKWIEKNKESVVLSQKKYVKKNYEVIKKKCLEYSKKYYQKNKDECIARRSEYYKRNREDCIRSIREAKKKAFVRVGDLVIHKFALYEVMKYTRGWFEVEKRYPWKDDFYYETMPDSIILVRRSLRKYMQKHHKKMEIEIEERFIPKV